MSGKLEIGLEKLELASIDLEHLQIVWNFWNRAASGVLVCCWNLSACNERDVSVSIR